jgi:hypothetical protein
MTPSETLEACKIPRGCCACDLNNDQIVQLALHLLPLQLNKKLTERQLFYQYLEGREVTFERYHDWLQYEASKGMAERSTRRES